MTNLGMCTLFLCEMPVCLFMAFTLCSLSLFSFFLKHLRSWQIIKLYFQTLILYQFKVLWIYSLNLWKDPLILSIFVVSFGEHSIFIWIVSCLPKVAFWNVLFRNPFLSFSIIKALYDISCKFRIVLFHIKYSTSSGIDFTV